MYVDDMPEMEVEMGVFAKPLEDTLIEDLKLLIADNKRRAENKIDAKGNPLTDTQLENLNIIITEQSLRLGKMLQKKSKKK